MYYYMFCSGGEFEDYEEVWYSSKILWKKEEMIETINAKYKELKKQYEKDSKKHEEKKRKAIGDCPTPFFFCDKKMYDKIYKEGPMTFGFPTTNKKVSDKREEEIAEYRKKEKEYFSKHPSVVNNHRDLDFVISKTDLKLKELITDVQILDTDLSY